MHSSCWFTGANVRPNNGVISLPSCKWTELQHVEFSRFGLKRINIMTQPLQMCQLKQRLRVCLCQRSVVCTLSGLCVGLCAQLTVVCVVFMTNITVWCRCPLS